MTFFQKKMKSYKQKREFHYSILAKVGILKTRAYSENEADKASKKFLERTRPIKIYGVEPTIDLRISDCELIKKI